MGNAGSYLKKRKSKRKLKIKKVQDEQTIEPKPFFQERNASVKGHQREPLGDNTATLDHRSAHETETACVTIETDKEIRTKIPTVWHGKLLTASIDIGTTYSGFAYSFRGNRSIYCQSWLSNSRFMSMKAPSCILFNPDQKFHSFGYDAEYYFHNNIDDEDFNDWYYFENLKMVLFENKDTLDDDTEITDLLITPKKAKMKLVDVLSAVFQLFKEQLLERVGKSFGSSTTFALTEKDIQWIVTVPSAWDSTTKEFFKECVIKGGLETENLMLASDSEVASVYCRNLHFFLEEGHKPDKVVTNLIEGSRYIVLDLGGGTIDAAVQEIGSGHQVKELHHACYCNSGSRFINEEFEGFLCEIFGEDVITAVKIEDMIDFHEVMCEFEIRKKAFKFSEGKHLERIKIPVPFFEHYRRINECKFEDGNWKTIYGDKVTFLKDKLGIKKEILLSFCENSISGIMEFLHRFSSNEYAQNINTVLAVGGFSRSGYLIEKIQSEFQHWKIFVPEEPDLAVLKGAILHADML